MLYEASIHDALIVFMHDLIIVKSEQINLIYEEIAKWKDQAN